MITIEAEVEKQMNEDALKAFPDECCGFMFGKEDESGHRLVTASLAVQNSSSDNKKVRFVISPKDYLKGEQFAMDNDLQLLGIYHSHPSHPAVPSEHDRVAAQPWFSYVIISVEKDVVKNTRSWVLNDTARFEEEIFNQTVNTTQ
ncbi:MAG TPA: M67 family metallopeptidase [Flavitalea sp.]|nr:M67 family metallopeptidase [Flavitalea sp.]